jgi:nitroimidazol reductase NimA-like FMN-containing flavoprotein (pyridoxamine 5'-phosphate oxidase superfamily)
MRTIDERTGLEVLSENECLLLLGRTTVGRLAVVDEGRPMVFPVNFRRDESTIVFRTDEGMKLDRVLEGGLVAFEVDELDPQTHAGWSVVATGRAHEVTDPEALAEVARLGVRPWPTGPKSRYVRIVPDTIEGRRLLRLDDAQYETES